MAPGSLRADHVDHERGGGRERGGDPEAVERPGVVGADDEERPDDREPDGGPQSRPEPPSVEDAQPDEQDQRGQVLDRERHPDLEAVDRDEVRALDEREAGYPHEGERRDVRPLDSQQVTARRGQREREDQEGAGRSELREPQGGQVIVEQGAGNARVERPERRRQGSEGVATPGVQAERGCPGGGRAHRLRREASPRESGPLGPRRPRYCPLPANSR